MKILIYYFIIITNAYITFEQKWNINLRKNESKDNNNDKSKNKSKRLKSFLLHISIIIICIILLYLIVRLIINCLKKKYAFKKLSEDFINNKLMKEEIIEQVKYIYGFSYVISFLKNIIFISCRYKERINEIKNCGNCSICQSGFDLSDKIFITSCNHVYHNKCMTDYLKLIIKEIDLEEKEIEDFHNFFKCPNCKEFLFINRKFILINDKENKFDIEEREKENNLEVLKNVEIKVIPKHSKKNINNIISTESSSIRNLSALIRSPDISNKKKTIKKHDFKMPENINNKNIINENENKKKIINSKNIEIFDGENNIQSDMRLKDNLNFQKNDIKVNFNQIENKENEKKK